MLPDTITLTGDDTVPYILAKKREGQFSSVYWLRDSVKEYRLDINHYSANPNKDGVIYDTHVIKITWTAFATDTAPEGKLINKHTITIPRDNAPGSAANVLTSLSNYMTAANMSQILDWES